MSRRILLDMRPALVKPTGVGRVALELARALARADPESRYVLFSNSRRDRFPAAEWTGPNVAVADRRIPHRLLAAAWSRLRWPPVDLLGGPCDVAHSFEPLPMPASRAKTVATVHDLFFLRHPEMTDPAETAHLRAGLGRLLPTADRIVTVTDHVRDEVLGLPGIDPAKVTTVGNGLRQDQLVPPTGEERSELRKRLRLPNAFILFVGTIEPRKNAAAAIRTLARLRERRRHDGCKLLVAGRRGWAHQSQEQAIADANITTEVRILDYLSNADVKVLMALARLVVVPSLDEGFSLPLLEAMALGTPVAASRRGGIPEVAGDAAVLFDPGDEEEMLHAVDRALNDEALRADLCERGPARAAAFTWDDAARKVMAIHADLAGSR